MAESSRPLVERIERLERQLNELRRHIQQLEQLLNERTEARSNQTAVREKVVFDWQS